MGFKNMIDDLKSQLEEEKKKEDETLEQELVIESEEDEKVKEEPIEEEKNDAKPELEKKESAEEEKPDNSAFARMRREKAAAEKRAQELEERIANLERTKAPEVPSEKIETEVSVDPVITELVQSHRLTQAEREFKSLEDRFRQENRDYDAVAQEYAMALAQAIKLQNPRLSSDDIVERTKQTILLKAGEYLNKGFDPIQELYHDAKEMGFGKKRQEPEKVKEEPELKPDMKKVAANRVRSSGMVAANGQSEGNLTPGVVAEYTPAQWKKLPKDQKVKIFQQLRDRAS